MAPVSTCMLFHGIARRLLITRTQPQLGNKSLGSSVGKGGKCRLEKDGMTECRKRMGGQPSVTEQDQNREGRIWGV